MTVQILQVDCLKTLRGLPSESVNCCVTSPPYWGLRDYGVEGQIGLEKTPQEYVAKLVDVFREVKRVLRGDGTLWLNLGDSYNGSGKASGRTWENGNISNMSRKQATNNGSLISKMPLIDGLKRKDLVGIPWRVAFALQADGWYLRQDIIWHKPNPMTESVTDRCTKAHEYIFLMSKSARYWYDAEAVREPDSGQDHRRNVIRPPEPSGGLMSEHSGIRKQTGRNGDGRNRRSVWTVATHPYPEAHFATYPPALVKPCILAGCPIGGTVLDTFGGSGTTGEVAERLGRNSILIELKAEYVGLMERRTAQLGLFA